MRNDMPKVINARWPALMRSATAAEYLDMNYSTFRRRLKEFQELGFPLPQQATGRFAKEAIDAWIEPSRLTAEGNIKDDHDPFDAEDMFD
ncbi:hypothetical protein [uncultured Roseibium sp.]|mgnify:CR=1 FL=1|jgi:hypothetical protein|uniref:hypothetical protein n=1 Tax=uncultured Roseibium sp. TaxID=1936171 RepID=UPI00261FE7D0|nr:hypothetical protein [uncultured Roseibium sp.]